MAKERMFDYKGREWFGIPLGCFIIAFIYAAYIAGGYATTWYTSMAYLVTFFMLGLGIISKKPLTGIVAVGSMIICLILSFNTWVAIPNFNTSAQILSVLAFVFALIAVADFAFNITTLKIETNWLLLITFVLLLVSNFIEFAEPGTFNTNVSTSIAFLSLGFTIAGLLSFISEMKDELYKKFPKLPMALIHNIGFLFAVVMLIVLVMTNSLGNILSLL